MKNAIVSALLVVFALPVLLGCEHFRRAWDHTKWHIHGAYQDLVEVHKEIDRHFFNLDERNPDRY